MATILQNAQRIKAASDDIREVIDLCYDEVAEEERIEDYAPKLARLAVDDATEQVIATAARTTAGGVAIKDTIAVVDKVYGNTLVWNQLGTPINATRFEISVTKSGKRAILNGTGTNASNSYLGIVHAASNVIAGHKYLNAYISQNEQLAWCSFNNGGRTRSIYTTDASHLFNYVISVAPTTTFENFWLIPILFDLTRMFGSGQEPESVDDFCLKIFGKASASVTDAEWEAVSAYCEPTLLSSKPKKVVSKEKSLWWNQLLNTTATSNENRGINVVKNANGSYTFSGTTTAGYNYVFTSSTTSISFYKAHKYLFGYCNTNRDCSSSVNLYLRDYTNSRSIAEVNLGGTIKCVISTNPYNGNGTAYVNYGTSGGKINCTIIPLVIDLTAMFGEGNEPTTINEFTQRIFGKDSDAVTDEEWASISAYNEGEELNYKLGTPFVSEIDIDPTAIVDEDGEQVFPNGLLSAGTAKDYIDIERGVAVKCIGAVDMGTMGWRRQTTSQPDAISMFIANIDDKKLSTNCITSKYNRIDGFYWGDYGNYPNNSFCGSRYSTTIFVKDEAYTDPLQFKTSLNGVMLYYELATPIEYPLPNRKCFYRVSNGGTEKITADGMTTPMVADIAYREAVTASEAVAMMAEASGIN